MTTMKPTRNLWPLGITLAFALFIAGTAGLIVIACSHKSDLVSVNYYEQEIKYQTRLDQLNRTAQFNDLVKVVFDHAARRIRITLPASHADPETSGRVQLYRPSATGLDRELRLQLDATGSQSLDAAALEPGFWKVRIHWTAHQQDYFADKSVVVKRGDRRRTSVTPVSNFEDFSAFAIRVLADVGTQKKADKSTTGTGATPVLR
jgi:nitrogen fixation protein FixH